MLNSDKEKKFRDIYNLYYPLILNILIKKAITEEDAEDICHEIFISFYNKFEKIDNYKNWLLGAVKYTYSNYYKKKATRYNNNDHIDSVFYDDNLKVINGFKDTRILLQEVLNSEEVYSDEQERVLYELVALNNYTKKQAGKQLGLSRGKVDYKLNQISKRIIALLKEKGIERIDDLL